jgi:hypothetical protein
MARLQPRESASDRTGSNPVPATTIGQNTKDVLLNALPGFAPGLF